MEKLQWFTVGWLSLYFLRVKNCNLSIIFHVVYFGLNECSYYKFSQLKNCKNWAKKLQNNSNLQNISTKDNLLEIALGLSIYYVLGLFLTHPPYISKKWQFSDPNHLCWRDMGMLPLLKKSSNLILIVAKWKQRSGV